jgi:adenylate cyclase
VDVVGRIANALGVELRKAESLRALRERPDNPDAIDLVMKGEQALVRNDPAANKEAIDEYEQALKLDPNLPRAQAGLAFALAGRTQLPGATDREADLDRAEKLANQALTTLPDNAFLLFAKAYVLSAKKQTEAAILEAEAAIKSDPNLSGPYAQLGVWRAFVGHAEQGFSDVEKAIKLSPRDPLLSQWQYYICHLHMHLAQWDQVIAPCQQAVAGNPTFPLPHLDLAAAYAFLGREAEAKAEVTEILKMVPNFTVKGLVSYATVYSDNPVFTQQIARLGEGLRKAGLPEQ